MRRWTGALAGAGLVLTVGVLGACSGGGGGINLPTNRPTSITVTLPTVPGQPETTTTLPPQTTTTPPPQTTTTPPPLTTTTEPPRTTTQTNTLTTTVTSTVTTTVTPTTTTTTTTPTTTTSTTSTTTSTTTTNTATAAPSPQPEPTSSGLAPWAWVVLALLLIGLIALVWWLVHRARVRAEWDDKMAQALRDATWLEDSLVQQVIDRGSTAEASHTWEASQPRVIALDESLYSLSTTGPDEERTAQATELRAKVAGLVQAMGAHLTPAPDATGDDLEAARAEVGQARADLRQFLDANVERRH